MAPIPHQAAYIAVELKMLFRLSATSSSLLASEPFASNHDVQDLFHAINVASKKFHGNSTNNHDLEFIPSAMPRSPESSCCSSPTLNPCSSTGGSVAGDTGLDLPDLDFNLK